MYTHAQTSKHEATCGHACLRVTYGMWRHLALWWGHYICEMAYIRLCGSARAFPTQGGILTEGSQPSFTLLIYFFFLHFYCISFMASPPLWSILKYLDSTMGINWYYVQTFMIHRGGIVLTLVIIPWLFLLKNGLWHWTISEIFLKNSVEKGRRFPKNTWQVIGRPICQSMSIMGELQPIRSTVGEQY